MGISADHDLPWCFSPFFEHNLVADTFIDVIVVNFLLGGKFPHVYMALCCRYGICRDLVVKEHNDAFRVKDFGSTHLVELLNGKWSGNIMNHCAVNGRHDNFTGSYLAATFSRKNFLYDSCSHAESGCYLSSIIL